MHEEIVLKTTTKQAVVKAKIRFWIFRFFGSTVRNPRDLRYAQNVVYGTACVYRELYGKVSDRKKLCQMCGVLVSCADFEAILTQFSEVI